jgi:SAM-dependent methyltransferase
VVRLNEAAVWHDVECGGYDADLALWRELAAGARGPVLELGAGTGRVALHLAARGVPLTAVDSKAPLLGELATRARSRELELPCVLCDARERLPSGFALIIAPMQFLQVLGGPEGRAAALAHVAAALCPNGRFAAALTEVDGAVAHEEAGPPHPDVAERDGWIYSSQPLDVRPEPAGVVVERLRQRVSPSGELIEERNTTVLESLTIATLEEELAGHGLSVVERRTIPPTRDHVGSEVAICA